MPGIGGKADEIRRKADIGTGGSIDDFGLDQDKVQDLVPASRFLYQLRGEARTH
jgi:hypothetical protein